MLSVLKGQEPELSEVNDNLSILMQQVDEKTPPATQVRADVSQADQKNKDLIDKLNARKANLEEDVKDARVFQESLAEIEAWLPEATERVSAQQPISTDPETVKKQLEEAEVCLISLLFITSLAIFLVGSPRVLPAVCQDFHSVKA